MLILNNALKLMGLTVYDLWPHKSHQLENGRNFRKSPTCENTSQNADSGSGKEAKFEYGITKVPEKATHDF